MEFLVTSASLFVTLYKPNKRVPIRPNGATHIRIDLSIRRHAEQRLAIEREMEINQILVAIVRTVG